MRRDLKKRLKTADQRRKDAEDERTRRLQSGELVIEWKNGVGTPRYTPKKKAKATREDNAKDPVVDTDPKNRECEQSAQDSSPASPTKPSSVLAQPTPASSPVGVGPTPKASSPAPLDVSILSLEEQEELLRLAAEQLGVGGFFDSLEELLTSPEGFGLATATAAQRALCRIIEGRPLKELREHPDVVRILGGASAVDAIDGQDLVEIIIAAGIRGAKSLIAAATAIWVSQKADVSQLGPGEIPRFSIVSLSKDNARVVLGHLLGALQKDSLRHLRIDAPKAGGEWARLIDETVEDGAGSILVRHPSGRPIEIRVVAGARAGGSLVSRWNIGCVLDEAPRMVGAAEGVINYDDARRAVRGRLLPGALLLSIGSPWRPMGPVYDVVTKEFGVPNVDAGRVVIRAPAYLLNPIWWTDARIKEMKESDPFAFKTDVEAEFADPDEALFPEANLAKCVRKQSQMVIQYDPRNMYRAWMDPATRGNAWTLVIADRFGNKKRIVFAYEWVGSATEPLRPKEVLQEAKELLECYGLDWCGTDQWSADSLIDIGHDLGIHLVVNEPTVAEKTKMYTSVATAMAEGTLSLPPLTNLLKDLRLVEKRASANGLRIHLPKTTDKRHCDFAPAVVQVLYPWIEEEMEDEPEKGSKEYVERLEQEMLEKEYEDVRRAKDKNNDEWWDIEPWEGELLQ